MIDEHSADFHDMILKAGDELIPSGRVRSINISRIEQGVITLRTDDGVFEAHGFDAIEIIYTLKPSALEGRRLRWKPHAWAFHNLVAHPLVQVMAWLGMKRQAIAFHDRTTPRPRDFRHDAPSQAPARNG